MSKITKRYETRLETASVENIKATLDAKLEATSPEQLTDYIAFALDNLDSQVARMKAAKKELDALIKANEAQKNIIKTQTAEWLNECGLDKLQGDITSSMTTYQPKAKETVKVLNEKALIDAGYFKTILDIAAIKEALENEVDIEGAELEVEHQTESLKINKRKAK